MKSCDALALIRKSSKAYNQGKITLDQWSTQVEKVLDEADRTQEKTQTLIDKGYL